MILKRKYPSYSCILPSKNKEVFFRPFLVSDEKTLLLIKEDKDTKIIFRSILDLIKDCFTEINVEELTIQDMEYLFCNLRAKSVGEQVKINFTCPDTNEKISSVMDLSKIEIITGIKEKQISLDANTKVILKEPTVSKILSLKGNFDTKHFVKASLFKVYIEDGVYDANDMSETDIDSLLSNLTIAEYEKIKVFVASLPKITGMVRYYTMDGKEKFMKLEGILNFFTHA